MVEIWPLKLVRSWSLPIVVKGRCGPFPPIRMARPVSSARSDRLGAHLLERSDRPVRQSTSSPCATVCDWMNRRWLLRDPCASIRIVSISGWSVHVQEYHVEEYHVAIRRCPGTNKRRASSTPTCSLCRRLYAVGTFSCPPSAASSGCVAPERRSSRTMPNMRIDPAIKFKTGVEERYSSVGLLQRDPSSPL